METIVLIACVNKKNPHKIQAKDLYISPLFKLNLKYAQSLNPNKIFILSAKYGLLDLEQKIEPYNLTLNNIKSKERKKWADKVINQLSKKVNLEKDKFVFLAGRKYREYLIPFINNYKIPLEGLSIGKQLKFLKEGLR